jgi:uncharacterized protein (TIGR02145 family)
MNIFKPVMAGVIAMSVCFLQGCSGTIKDADGNVYKTVKIGKQVWMAENLRTTRFNDGSAIPQVMDGHEWENLASPGYCYYNNTSDSALIKKYGALYNWFTVKTGKLAPAGWRVPTDKDWNILQNYLINHGYNYDGTKSENRIAKSLAAQTDWSITTGKVSDTGSIGDDLTKNNRSGFSAFPSGYRSIDGKFTSEKMTERWSECDWWSSTAVDSINSYNLSMDCFGNSLDLSENKKGFGFSARCVRDH